MEHLDFVAWMLGGASLESLDIIDLGTIWHKTLKVGSYVGVGILLFVY